MWGELIIEGLFEGKVKINSKFNGIKEYELGGVKHEGNIIIGGSGLYAELKDDNYIIKQVQEINLDNNIDKIQIVLVDYGSIR